MNIRNEKNIVRHEPGLCLIQGFLTNNLVMMVSFTGNILQFPHIETHKHKDE